jgi:hypothetical protein
MRTSTPREIASTSTSVGAATETILKIDTEKRLVKIDRVMVQRNSGTAANYTPAIGNATGFTTGTTAEKYLGTTVAVAVLTDDTNIDGYTSTDDTGNLYLLFKPDAGADNSFTYSIFLTVY